MAGRSRSVRISPKPDRSLSGHRRLTAIAGYARQPLANTLHSDPYPEPAATLAWTNHVTPTELLRVKELFLEALERAPDQRAAWLDAQADAPEAVRQQVALQLRLYDGHPDLAPVSDAVEHETDSVATEQALADPESIAHYRVVGRLGEGGMGVVYACEQTEPVRRRVAVKRLKAGMDSAAISRRFEAERQALARMSHANIAQVFDGGVDASGRLYFAMELVEGEPITTYCDRHRLSIEARIRLFVTLCRGVEHAHRRGVLHRDLKPANALVTEADGKPVPKIIDFGIAKALGERLGDESLHTRHGAVMGTPDYMSPEAALGSADLDTRSDMYSLGVVLYELLTGLLPVARDDRTAASTVPSSSQANIAVAAGPEPMRPSSRFRRTTVDPGDRATARGATGACLFRSLRNDLDWIVLRALQSDRERRYDSVGALAQDLERFLAHLPVEAGPPSLLYRMRRGLRRHRFVVASAAAIGVSMIGGVAFAWSYARDADRARGVAEDNRLLAEDNLFEVYDALSRSVARSKFHDRLNPDVTRLNRLQDRILAVSDPTFAAFRQRLVDNDLSGRATADSQRRMLDYLLTAPSERAPMARVVVGDLLHESGRRALVRGGYDQALDAAEGACSMRANETVRFDPRPLGSRLLALDALLGLGRYQEVLDRVLGWTGEAVEPANALVKAQFAARCGAAWLGQAKSVASGTGREPLLSSAEEQLSQAQGLLRAHAPSTRGAFVADAAWVELCELRGERERAKSVLARLRAALGRSHSEYLLYRPALGYEPGSEELWQAMDGMWQTSRRSGNVDLEARVRAFDRFQAVLRESRIEDHDARWPPLLSMLNLVGNSYVNLGLRQQGLELADLAVRLTKVHADACPPAYSSALSYRSVLLLREGVVAGTEELARAALSVPWQLGGRLGNHWYAYEALGMSLVRGERFGEGFEQLRRAWLGLADANGPNETNTQNALGKLAIAAALHRQHDAAAARRAIDGFEVELGPRERFDLETALTWAAAQGFDREQVLERSGRLRGQTVLRRPAGRLAEALSRIGELDLAIRWFEVAARESTPGQRAWAWCAMAGALFRHGRHGDAVQLFERAIKLAPGARKIPRMLASVQTTQHEQERLQWDGLELNAGTVGLLFKRRDLMHRGELAFALTSNQTVYEVLSWTVDIGGAWLEYLLALARHDRTAEARQTCDRLLEDPFRGLETRDAVARFLVTADGLNTEDRERGLQVARDAYERSGRGGSARIEATLAEAELATGARAAAIARLRRIRDALRRRSAEWITVADVEQRLRELER